MRALLHGVGSYPAGGIVGPCCWPHFDLLVVTAGRVDFVIGRRRFRLDGGDACLIPPSNPFRGVAGGDGATLWVQHFETSQDSHPAPGILWGPPVRLPGVARGEWPRALMRRANQLQTVVPQTATTHRTTGFALSLLVEEFSVSAKRRLPRPNSAASRIRQTIEWAECYEEPPPTIARMAAHAGWSVNHFREKFHQVAGRTVGSFLRDLCMSRAERMLRETNLPIKEISAHVGYSDVIAFYHAFRHRFQTTPARYRQSIPRVM